MPRLEFKDNNVACKTNEKKVAPLMCFTHLQAYALMNKRNNIFLLSGLSTKTSFDSKTFSTYVENWTSKQIIRWIEGIGECVKPWIHLLESNILSGKHLLIVDDDYLSRIGIAQLGPRRVICQAVQLLIQNCAELRVENLQMLTMNVRIAAVTLAREMMTSQRLRETAHTRTQMVTILNELIFWLDRSPFDSIQCYIDFRMRVLVIVLQVLRMINVPPKILFNSSSEIIKRAYELRDQCDWVIRECDDPLIISTSYIDKIVLRRHSSTTHWGLNLFSSYRGAHVISEIKIGSPADLCSQVDAGDEILMINDETVVGWDLSAVAERLGSGAERRTELTLVLRKMPNLDLPANTLLRERETPKPKAPRILTNLAPGSLISNFAIDEDDSKQLPEIEPRSPIKRRRSSTFKTVLQRFFKGGLQSSAQSASSQSTNDETLAPKKRRFRLKKIFRRF
ncbi:unnamed protein product, partial [Mesorhabditis belari]|uniref:Uncharacterized protein n=1 Tax=Mesorhabditis belari TaxID=2138241 RepID=A0AAF3EAZ5_9BILA